MVIWIARNPCRCFASFIISLMACYAMLRWIELQMEPSEEQLLIGQLRKSKESEERDTLIYCNTFTLGNTSNQICGKPFSASWVPYLKRLMLTSQQISKMTKKDDHSILKKDPVFVTAFDDSHTGVAMSTQMKSFSELYPTRKMIVYDLGLSKNNIKKLQAIPLVQSVRRFNFAAYPAYVRNLMEYRWKPLLLAEVLQEFEAVFYVDAHILWQKEGNMTDLLEKVHCQVDGCDYYSSLLMGDTGHSIFATTDKRVYEYFPIDDGAAKRIEMGEAGFQLTYYTRDVRLNIHKWYVLCALEENCMGPKGAGIYCRFTNNESRWKEFANCHRYDQSVVNILLSTRNGYNRSRYFIPFKHTRA